MISEMSDVRMRMALNIAGSSETGVKRSWKRAQATLKNEAASTSRT